MGFLGDKMNSKTKLQVLGINSVLNIGNTTDIKSLFSNFEAGFKEAFKLIDENLSKELSKLEQFPFMGERIMTLKLYKKKIQSYLEEMEIPYD